MKENKYRAKRFLLPILSLVLVCIVLVASISAYITTNMFKNHMEEHIEQTKKEYTQKHKNRVFKKVDFVNESIRFQITKIEKKLRVSLKEKVKIALSIATNTYNTYKDTHTKKEIKEKISLALSGIKFNNENDYYFMYDSKTKVVFTHPIEKFIDKDMNNFKDSRGQNLVDLETKALEKDDIAYIKIYFNKPNNLKKEFPKIICITKFEPLDIVLGIGEYLDVIEKQIKGYVLNRFSQIKDNKEDRYLFILDVHDMKGGDDFATVLLNSNKPELVGRKVSDKGTDVKGNRFRKNFLNLIEKNGGGYSEYWYKKPSTKTPALKMSYVYLQKDWNWIIGSGFYYEDLEKQVSIMQKSITSHTNNTINEMLLWVSLLSFFAIIIAIFVSYMIDKTIKKYTNTIIEYEDNKRKQENVQVQQSKMAAMGEMLGNIAHQWRQPLSAISTAATGAKIQKEMDCLTDNQLMSSLTAINKSAQYLSSTINDFRTFLEPSESKISKFNISDTLDKTLNLLNAQFSAKDIEIIKNIESSELKSIENELIQVLMNILNNARDALITKEKQKRLIFIDSYKKDNTLFIEILDNAGGVSETIIDRIFEPYFTTKHKSQGTGIGLYMSQDIVKNHLNGLLLVSNKEYHHKDTRYKGAKFTIKISLC